MPGWHSFDGCIGYAAHRRVFLGFAQSNLLYSLSFADVLNEDTGQGYQRKFSPEHSLDFRNYIQKDLSTTIPLAFNLRPASTEAWKIVEVGKNRAKLRVSANAGKVFAQVDCQHRMGFLGDVDLQLPFMCFLGLGITDEIRIFDTINSKARGLSTSLLDFHDATLSGDLAAERPELYIALQLNNIPESPWHRQLDLGGDSTSGLRRRASLRTIQKATKRFLGQTRILKSSSPQEAARVVMDFWTAVALVLRVAWDIPRRHLINKGIGVYALMGIAADLYLEAGTSLCDKKYFTGKLSEFIGEIDWTTDGPLKGLGGHAGVKTALGMIRETRIRQRYRLFSNG